MLNSGETVPTVAAYLGHATPAIGRSTYARAVLGATKRAADRLAARIRAARTGAGDGGHLNIAGGRESVLIGP